MTPLQSMSRRQKSDSKKAASRGLQWTSDMIRKIVDDKTYIGCMVYGKTKNSRSRNWERSTSAEKSVESDGKSSRADRIKRSF